MRNRIFKLLILTFMGPASFSDPLAADEAPALRIPAQAAPIRTVGGKIANGWAFWGYGEVGACIHCERTGTYTIAAEVYGTPSRGEWPAMGLALDCAPREAVSVNWSKPRAHSFQAELPAGTHRVTIWFLNNDYVPPTTWQADDYKPGPEKRNLCVNTIAIRPPAGTPVPRLATLEQWVAQQLEEEKTLLQSIEPSIDANRKENAAVRVVSAGGKPIAGARVNLEQVEQEFLFGANTFLDQFAKMGRKPLEDKFKERYEALFNYATVGFFWRSLEPQEGKPDYKDQDYNLAWLEPAGIRIKCLPLLWNTKYGGGFPDWSGPRMPAPEVQKRHVQEVMRRYRDRIQFWEVVNEPVGCPLKLDDPYRWAREANPDATLIVNDYVVMSDGYPPLWYLVKGALEKKLPVDAIGIQAHVPQYMRFPLGQVWRILDAYAALGRPIHITEFCPSADGAPVTHDSTGIVHSGVWDEATQADYAEKFYRVCFAHPAVAAITWLDPYEGFARLWWRNKPKPDMHGLWREDDDMSPKPAYQALRRFIREEWMTRAQGATDGNGCFSFRGFRGRYRVKATADRGVAAGELRLSKTGKNELILRLRD